MTLSKKTLAFILCLLLTLASLSCAALGEEGVRFVTVQEWLDAKGDCGSCLVLLRIREVLNPVLAVGEDETGSVNLYSGGEDRLVLVFGDENGTLDGYWLVIGDPVYNEFEGTVEMAGWTPLRLLPPLE